IRLIAAFLIILFVPSLTKTFDLVQFNKALLFVIKFHCIIVFFDTFVTYPWVFDQDGFGINTRFVDHERAQGLFGEPSFFAAYTGLTASLVLQFQANSNKKIIKPIDLGIIFVGMISSSSLTGVFLVFILVLQFCFIERNKIFKFTSFSKLLFIGTISSLVILTLLTFSVTYLSGRLSNIEDGSTLQRMVGSTVLAGQIIDERPLTGVGLGGTNFRSFYEKTEAGFIFDSIDTESEGGVALKTTSTTYWTALLAGGGLPLLILFYIPILGTLVFNKKTMYVGVMIFFIGISKTGVFEISLWWTIATVLGFKYYQESVTIDQNRGILSDYKS
ncbi:hypothetical protein OAJ48_00480, partial [Gammaproteobacteria bacterium]|nr:hypothetical protein [Gammaproteobacteria bacterium]MDC0064472.1 hypothetical protein [Gammaproteobacteria bacterium]